MSPTRAPVLKTTPSASICLTRRSMCDLSNLKSGMPKRSRPPMRVVLLEHGHSVADAGQLLCRRHAGRAEPTIGDLLAGLDRSRLRH